MRANARRLVARLCVKLLVVTAACSIVPVTAGGSGEPVSTVTLTPPTPSVGIGQTVQLTATLKDDAGAVLADRLIIWFTSNPAIATVTGTGLVRGTGEGVVTIAAISEGRTGTATVTVTAEPVTPEPVVTIDIEPAAPGVAVGETVQLTATPRDASGEALSGRTVSWSSANPAIASVSQGGLVTGVTGGSAEITATIEGVQKSVTATVTAPATSISECDSQQAAWIWCDDFEQDRLASYFEYDSHGGNFVRATSVGLDASSGMRARWTAIGQVEAGALHLAFGKTPQSYFRPVDAGTTIYREIYWRVYVRYEAAWTGGGADKLTRAMSFASTSTWAQAMIAHVWSGTSPNQDYLLIDPASGTDASGTLRTTTYNDFANLRWLGAVRGTTPIFDAAHVGQWHCVEAHIRLNDAGQANGIFELHVNGALEARKTGLNWVGSFSSYGINAVFLENYWNNGATRAQERYFDNFVVSTQPIGCMD